MFCDSQLPASCDGRRFRRPAPRPAWWTWVVVCLAVAGCGGPDGPERVAVAGNVTLDGVALAKGSIRFVPQRPAAGPRAGGLIVDGRYKIERDHGPVVGTMRVEIWPDDAELFRQVFAAHSRNRKREPADILANLIPVRYNDQSTLVVETTSEGPNRFDFDLKNKPSR